MSTVEFCISVLYITRDLENRDLTGLETKIKTEETLAIITEDEPCCTTFKSLLALMANVSSIHSQARRPSRCLSLRCLFGRAIADAVAAIDCRGKIDAECCGQRSDVPIRRVQRVVPGAIAASSTQARLRYVSAIALKLAPTLKQAPEAIAQRLSQKIAQATRQLSPLNPSPFTPKSNLDPSQIWPLITIEATTAGWIFFSLGDKAIAAWLDAYRNRLLHAYPSDVISRSDSFDLSSHLDAATAQASMPVEKTEKYAIASKSGQAWSDDIWLGQYAHARCCALDRLAAAVGLSGTSPSWLAESSLRLNSAADLRLIASVIDAEDERCDIDDAPLSHRRLAKRLSSLSQDTLALYASYPLFGDCLRNEPEVAIARFELLQSARCALKHLLEVEFGAIAPEQL